MSSASISDEIKNFFFKNIARVGKIFKVASSSNAAEMLLRAQFKIGSAQ